MYFKHKDTQWHSWMSYFFVPYKNIDKKKLSINLVMSEIILRCYQSLKRASHKIILINIVIFFF